jgi:hypothetical protein
MAILTVKELDAHISHYNVFGSLPAEVMEYLFGAAMSVAVLSSKDPVATLKEADEILVDPKPKKATKAPRPNPADGAPQPPGHFPVG